MLWAKTIVLMLVLCVQLAPAMSSAPTSETPPIQSEMRERLGKALPLFPKTDSYDDYGIPFRSAGGDRISSGFGWRWHPILGYFRPHRGLDFPKPYGTPIYPARNGVVTYAGWRRGYGWMVELRHGDGGRTIYGHLSRLFVATGQWAGKDKLLGLVGSSGLSTGPHLHFECLDPSGRALDPLLVLNRR